jgi:hypothetical protein
MPKLYTLVGPQNSGICTVALRFQDSDEDEDEDDHERSAVDTKLL